MGMLVQKERKRFEMKNKKKKERIDIFECKNLSAYEMSIEAKGEKDYYKKVRIVALVERIYDVKILDRIVNYLEKIK